MRLDFNVLWIDNEPGNIRGTQASVKRKLANEGFNLDPRNVTTIRESLAYLSDDVLRDEIDLVLVDYDLGDGPKGDTALKEIRTTLPFKEIVFYSANSPADLRDLAFKQGVQGIYCAHRNDLVDTVVGVFETLVKKVLDIDHMRGIVMGATSEIDVIVQDCLLAMHDALDEKGKNEMLKQAIVRIQKAAKNSEKSYKKVLKRNNLTSLLEDRSGLTADSKIIFLTELLEQEQYKQFSTEQQAIKAYRRDVVPKRNILGHAKLLPADGTQIFKGRDGETVTADEMKVIRCTLLDHRAAFSSLLKGLSTNP